MGKKQLLDDFCDMLDSYGGRDKVMKALCYSAKLISGLYKKKDETLSKKFGKFSSTISSARCTLRLLDDIPMIRYSIEYGLGENEPDRTMSFLGVVANIVDHVYYPIEKVCWLIEHKLLDVENPDKWDTISSFFWVISIYLNLTRTLRTFSNAQEHKKCLYKGDESNPSENLAKLIQKQRMEVISIIRLSLDLTHAVSTLPKGYLWGGKLETWHVGFIGTLSAALGIYQYFAKKKMSK